MRSDAEDIPEEMWEGIEDYDEGRDPEPTDEDALDYDPDTDRACSWPCKECGESYDDEDDSD